jgi:hypothetical protein
LNVLVDTGLTVRIASYVSVNANLELLDKDFL